jgi:hypothetical protein
MSQCPQCGLQRGLHHSVLPGCLCTTAGPYTYPVVQPTFRDDTALLRQALEALETLVPTKAPSIYSKAIDALRTRLGTQPPADF